MKVLQVKETRMCQMGHPKFKILILKRKFLVYLKPTINIVDLFIA